MNLDKVLDCHDLFYLIFDLLDREDLFNLSCTCWKNYGLLNVLNLVERFCKNVFQKILLHNPKSQIMTLNFYKQYGFIDHDLTEDILFSEMFQKIKYFKNFGKPNCYYLQGVDNLLSLEKIKPIFTYKRLNENNLKININRKSKYSKFKILFIENNQNDNLENGKIIYSKLCSCYIHYKSTKKYKNYAYLFATEKKESKNYEDYLQDKTILLDSATDFEYIANKKDTDQDHKLIILMLIELFAELKNMNPHMQIIYLDYYYQVIVGEGNEIY